MGFDSGDRYGLCPNCATPRPDASSAFCPNCGTTLAAGAPAPAPVPAPPAYAPPPPPANYNSPPSYYPPVPAAPIRPVGSGPKILLAGIAILAIVAAGFYFFVINSSPGGGITFSPATVNCAAPVAFTSTLRLPASVKVNDVLTTKLDGQVGGTLTVGSDSSIAKQADGTWLGTSTTSAADVMAACSSGGITDSGIGVLAPGTHTMQVLNASGSVLASGSYTVTGTGVAASGTAVPPTIGPIVTPSSTPVPKTGEITFVPSMLSCDSPAAFTTTETLPASASLGETLIETLDGKVTNTWALNTDFFTRQSDGRWQFANTITADQVGAVCAAGGIDTDGFAMFTPGTHTMQVADAAGSVLAEGSYTVAVPTVTPAPTDTPAPVYDGQVLFGTVDPSSYSECAPANPITEVSVKTSVYVTFIFDATAGSEKFTYAITKNGAAFSNGTITGTSGYDCVGEGNDLSKLTGWGPGLYHFVEYRDGDIIGVGDLTVK